MDRMGEAHLTLTMPEVRVLGSLVEKAMTTPDHYPMTLNALLAACNQRTSREPVVDYHDAVVIEAVNGLRDRGLCRLTHSPGQRAAKYKQAADEVLGLSPAEAALVAVLMLRGEQTPGELRARTGRYHEFDSLSEVEATLDELGRREPPLLRRLERRPGEKEYRYRHLLGGTEAPAPDVESLPVAEPVGLGDRVHQLEEEVAALRAEVGRLNHELGLD